MVTPEAIYDQLKTLPASDLERAADYIQQLKRIGREDRLRVLRRTGGSLSAEEADEIERAILEGCERVDAGEW